MCWEYVSKSKFNLEEGEEVEPTGDSRAEIVVEEISVRMAAIYMMKNN